MTLPLYGTASPSAGFCSDKARSVVRLRSVDSTAERHAADFALVKTPDEVRRAIEAELAVDLCRFGRLNQRHVPEALRRTADRGASEI